LILLFGNGVIDSMNHRIAQAAIEMQV
jgi:hypothetical protein